MTGQILVASEKGRYAIRMVGDVRMVLCLSFDRFIQSMFADDAFDSVIFDLCAAEAVDSTTLGLMAKIAIKCDKRDAPKPVLIAEAPSMLRLLETMGFDDIFVIGGCSDVIDAPCRGLDCLVGSEDLYRERVVEAHKVLMSLNDRNHQAFRELVDSLDHPSA